MRFFNLLIFSLIAQAATAQCSVLSFTLTTLGTDAEVVFEATGAAEPLYVMDWGDGSIDTSLVPVLYHSYASDGYYEAIYYYSDQTNPMCTEYSFYPFIITGGLCSLSFTATNVSNGVYIESFAQNVSVPLVTINWGDGSPDTMAYDALHAYAQPGTYEVCLSMTDGDPVFPCEVLECQNVEVVGPIGTCDVQVVPVLEGQSVSLAITSSLGSAAYLIDWGDGSVSESPAAGHTYSIPDTYTLCVYYGSPGDISCQATVCLEILIDPFASDCVFQIAPIVTGMGVELQVQQAGAAQPEIFVDWGDGSNGEYGLPAAYEYATEGTYTICASYTDLTNPIGCQINDCVDVVIGQVINGCDVSLVLNQTGALVTAIATGTGAVEPTYFIDWGDSSLPTLTNEGSHEYINPLAYDICVTYSDVLNQECMATACETVNILAGVAEFGFISSFQFMPNPVTDEAALSFNLQLPSLVCIDVVDVSGRRIETIYNGIFGQGRNRLNWNAVHLASGIYVIRLTASGETKSMRVTK